MLRPGTYPLVNSAGSDFTITAAGTQTGEWVTEMEGLLGLLADLRFQYGSGGADVRAYLQTSTDQGVTAQDIACCLFAVAAEHKKLNFSALTPKTTQVAPTDGAMTDDTSVDGLLGDRFRMKIVSTGTYAGSTVLSARITAR